MRDLQKLFILIIFYLLLTPLNSIAQNVGINATGVAPHESALLDLNSTSKGFLITRVDTANISSPAFGLMTLSPIDSCLYMYSGLRWMSLGGFGYSCSCGSTTTPITPPAITFPCDGTVIPVVEVVSTTGQIWMDRNLGASQVATSSSDSDAYGDLYQWGRCSDGHEKRTSSTTSVLSATDMPGHGDFIVSNSGNEDWRSPQNHNLWQGVTGINNPCPTGYRIPTEAEYEAERVTWSSNDGAGAFASPLKLTYSGVRLNTGVFFLVDTFGYYWSSTFTANEARYIYFSSNNILYNQNVRALAASVRCIKN